MKRFLTMLVGAAVLGVGVTSAQAQAVEGSGWMAWYGCWRSSGEPSAPGETVCVLPGESPASARFTTIEDGRIAQETVIHADGVARPVEEGGCAGSQTANFSSDGRRVYTRSDLTCSNSPRVTTGVLGFAAPDRWVDSQALTVRDQHAARSVVYELTGSAGMPPEVVSALPTTLRLAQEAARLDVSAPMEIEGILEASGRLAPPALDGYLAAGQTGYDVDARDLVRLRDGGVSPSTIDVMIAVSYPERFAVRSRDQTAPVEQVAMRNAMIQNYCYDPFWSGRFNDCYNSFGYGSRYGSSGYSPWGYDPYGWRYSRDPIFVIVEPETEGGGTVDRTRGYTPGPSSSPGTATRRSGSGSSETSQPSSSPRTSSGSSDSGGSSSGSGGYTPSGDNSSSTGRTARPRGSSE